MAELTLSLQETDLLEPEAGWDHKTEPTLFQEESLCWTMGEMEREIESHYFLLPVLLISITHIQVVSKLTSASRHKIQSEGPRLIWQLFARGHSFLAFQRRDYTFTETLDAHALDQPKKKKVLRLVLCFSPFLHNPATGNPSKITTHHSIPYLATHTHTPYTRNAPSSFVHFRKIRPTLSPAGKPHLWEALLTSALS